MLATFPLKYYKTFSPLGSRGCEHFTTSHKTNKWIPTPEHQPFRRRIIHELRPSNASMWVMAKMIVLLRCSGKIWGLKELMLNKDFFKKNMYYLKIVLV